MASDLSRDDLRRLARIGAQRRLEDLRREEAAILAAFPDLAGRGGRRGARTEADDREPAAPAGRRARRRKMSAAEKRQVSERMKKYWAAKRKTKA